MDLSFSVGIKIVFMVIVAPINFVVSTQSLDTGNRHAMLRARANMLICECCSHRQKRRRLMKVLRLPTAHRCPFEFADEDLGTSRLS
jgi:hypothetical protein